MSVIVKMGPNTYGYRGYVLQHEDKWWVAYDAETDAEVFVRTARKDLVRMIDAEKGES